MSRVKRHEIAGLPGYAVGKDGSIWSRWKRGAKRGNYSETWTLLRTVLPRRQRRAVSLGGRYFNVDRLVLETFVGLPPEPTMDAIHLDGDTWNDHADNLAWGFPAPKPVRSTVGTRFSIPDEAYARLPEPVRALFPENSFFFVSLVTKNSTTSTAQ